MGAIEDLRNYIRDGKASSGEYSPPLSWDAILELADAVVRIDKEMDDLRFQAEWMQEIEGRVKALEHPEDKPLTEERFDPFATEYTYEVTAPGEPSACIPSVYDEVTILVGSGNPGGDDGEFEEYMRKAIAEWYDTPTVKLVAIGTRSPPPDDEALIEKIDGILNAYLEGETEDILSLRDLARKIIAAVRGQS